MFKYCFAFAAVIIAGAVAVSSAELNRIHRVRSGLESYVRGVAKIRGTHLKEKHEKPSPKNGFLQCPVNTTTCTGPASAGGSVCCTGGESPQRENCCPDPVHGGVCCVAELTFCCAPNAQYDMPSRCCPRWSVCCDKPGAGHYGCCDPDTGKPIEEMDTLARGEKKQKKNAASVAVRNIKKNGAVKNITVTALIQEPNWFTDGQPLYAAKIESGAGTYKQSKVSPSASGRFDPVGELPRSFVYNRAADVFYLLQANFTAPPSAGGDPKRQIMLYTISAKTGATNEQVVSGADDEVTGFYYVEAKSVLVFGTLAYADEKKTTPVGYNFFVMDPKTAAAKLVSKSITGPSVDKKYDGWFHAVSDDLHLIYRLGYQHVRSGVNFGLEVTDISTETATVTFTPDVFVPPGHNQYKSLTLMPGTSPTARAVKKAHGFSETDTSVFISLAPNSTTMSMDAFMWTAAEPSKPAKEVATFKNAHRQPYFGPVQEAVDADGETFTALVVADSPWGSNSDTVSLVTANIKTGESEEVQLNPKLLAETCGFAGLGIARN